MFSTCCLQFEIPSRISPQTVIWAAWTIFVLFWFVAAFNRKATQKRESFARRLIHVAFMAIAFIILDERQIALNFLAGRLWPDLAWIAELGALLTVVGIAFSIWARVHIGRNWSGQVMIKKDHELIRSGPYARIRHPIYTGLLLAVFGTFLEIGEARALLAFVLILLGFSYKAKREEALLAGHFGPAFDEHKKHTGFFFPRLT